MSFKMASLNSGRSMDPTPVGAALDVYSEVPPRTGVLRKLVAHPKVISMVYVAAFTEESLYAMDSMPSETCSRCLEERWRITW